MTAMAHVWRDTALARAWIGAGTPVATPLGSVAAARLRPGDPVLTAEGRTRIRAVARSGIVLAQQPAPVLLRAPYFAARSDLLVSQDQPVVLSGATVEYLFGEEAVQVEARLLVDGRTALWLGEEGIAEAVALVLDRAGSLVADGCALAMPGPEGAVPRLLSAYEAAAFRSHRWEANRGRAA